MTMRCPFCGRFMSRVYDAYLGIPVRWQCSKAWYAGEGQWEHE